LPLLLKIFMSTPDV